ncbi:MULTISPECIES: hypothetical protein [unclassified Bradyrhizobium]|uniref:hypothetical protein n=1 Tax=unclassified Bradyrhizobium TaxID=2631580 RepID=UPI0029164EF2|nr:MULTISPECIES: hypothetical protein [unclassified Bradyrhizobium]
MTNNSYTIIVPVWGAVHVARFLDWALPTWLSPRNLPALAARGTVELMLLTSERDFAAVESSPMTALLRESCKLRLVAIDDLVPGGISTVTLTLAFTRGVNLAMAADSTRRIIFLNGDFLLTDGSLVSIANRFDAGQKVLLCSSVRVREELVRDDFLQMRGSDGVMVVPSREAVGLALGALHPTVLACRVDQSLLRSAHPNQFFWKPDSGSLVLRAFLLFPLAVAPTCSPGPADTYCDFGWISTMVDRPSADIIDDTDELFIVELAPTGQELDFVRSGAVSVEDSAQRMSTWMTDFSAQQADTAIVFRSRDGSEAAIAETIEASARFIAELKQHFGPLNPVRKHPYWQAGAASYLRNRGRLGYKDIPAEIAPTAAELSAKVTLRAKFRDFVKRQLLGAPGSRRRWHPYFRAEQVVKELGPLKPVGPVAILDLLAPRWAEQGSPVSIVECYDWESTERAITRLYEATRPGQSAYLIVANDLHLVPGHLRVRERIVALAVIERKFKILSTMPFMNLIEVNSVASNRRLATDFDLATPLRSARLALASALSLRQVLVANLFGWNNQKSTDQSNILLLKLWRGAESPKAVGMIGPSGTGQRSGVDVAAKSGAGRS